MRHALGLAIAVLAGCGGPPSTGFPQTHLPNAATTSMIHRSAGPSYQVIHDFGHGLDGIDPAAGLIDVNGTLYGTTSAGGAKEGCAENGCGTVYSIDSSGVEKVVYRFRGGTYDGAAPQASLLEYNGTLYGTTSKGGSYNKGTVFSVSSSGAEKVLHSFGSGSDGAAPVAALVNLHGTLYGTTYNGGGSCNCGTVYSITPGGVEKMLYAFAGGSDGEYPAAGLIDVNGTLYGTTFEGGSASGCHLQFGCGTVYSISTSGVEKVLFAFHWYDGAEPLSGLIDVNGMLYGATWTGTASLSGINGCGLVYSITASGVENVVYSFNCAPDGQDAAAGVIDVKGALYGTTYYGGRYIVGNIYRVTLAGKERRLHSFQLNGSDGLGPAASLIYRRGKLYGTTDWGGNGPNRQGCYSGCGTVFALTP